MSGWLGLVVLSLIVVNIEAWGSSGKMKLTEIKALTLYHGKMTTGRRSDPVPQLRCIGGTAANVFTPKVVQCYNRGDDGYDVQWECKSDLNNAYRFGKLRVTCEGYDYPKDAYVLLASCGLEYNLDFTKEGWAGQQKQSQSNYYYSSYYYDSYEYPASELGSGRLANISCLIVLCIIIYIIYKTCIARSPPSPPVATNQQNSGNRTASGFGGTRRR